DTGGDEGRALSTSRDALAALLVARRLLGRRRVEARSGHRRGGPPLPPPPGGHRPARGGVRPAQLTGVLPLPPVLTDAPPERRGQDGRAGGDAAPDPHVQRAAHLSRPEDHPLLAVRLRGVAARGAGDARPPGQRAAGARRAGGGVDAVLREELSL